jgi:hypothetical protein
MLTAAEFLRKKNAQAAISKQKTKELWIWRRSEIYSKENVGNMSCP